jgi:hypothetical protein
MFPCHTVDIYTEADEPRDGKTSSIALFINIPQTLRVDPVEQHRRAGNEGWNVVPGYRKLGGAIALFAQEFDAAAATKCGEIAVESDVLRIGSMFLAKLGCSSCSDLILWCF